MLFRFYMFAFCFAGLETNLVVSDQQCTLGEVIGLFSDITGMSTTPL